MGYARTTNNRGAPPRDLDHRSPYQRKSAIARNKSPQTFEKRKREMEKKRKRADKMESRLDRNYWKKVNKANGTVGAPPPADGGWYYFDDEEGAKG